MREQEEIAARAAAERAAKEALEKEQAAKAAAEAARLAAEVAAHLHSTPLHCKLRFFCAVLTTEHRMDAQK